MHFSADILHSSKEMSVLILFHMNTSLHTLHYRNYCISFAEKRINFKLIQLEPFIYFGKPFLLTATTQISNSEFMISEFKRFFVCLKINYCLYIKTWGGGFLLDT